MLSILIVNWNTRDLLRACLKSIERFPPMGEYEVIVVDNASKDGSAEMVATEFPKVRLANPGKNTGYAEGNNVAFSMAKGEWLLTLNPDTEVLEGTLQGAIDVLASHQGYGVLGVRQVGPGGKTQRSIRGFPRFWGVFGDLSGLGRLFPRSRLGSYRLPAFDYEAEQDAPQPMGTFLLFRREALSDLLHAEARRESEEDNHGMQGEPRKSELPRAKSQSEGDGLEKHGGTRNQELVRTAAQRARSEDTVALRPFDVGFPIFFNEVDLLYRLAQRGWKTLYCPSVSIKHLGGESTKQVRKSMIWESHRSLMRFFEKHYRTRLTAPFLPLLRGLVYAGAFVRAKGYHAGFQG